MPKSRKNEAYPWYSKDKDWIWENIRLLLTIPDRKDCRLSYSSLKDYFLTIEALEGDNAWNYFLEHYGTLADRFTVSKTGGYSSWCFAFYNLILALDYTPQHQTAKNDKVRDYWYSNLEYRLLEEDIREFMDSKKGWSWSNIKPLKLPPQSTWEKHDKYPVRALSEGLLQAIGQRDLGRIMLEIDLAAHQDTKLKNVRHALLNVGAYDLIVQLQQKYAFPKEEDVPEVEYFLWDSWNRRMNCYSVRSACMGDEFEKAVVEWREDNDLVRFFSFNEMLCDMALEQLEKHDMLTPAMFKAVLEHKGKDFNIKIPHGKMVSLAGKLDDIVESLPENQRARAWESLNEYVRKSHFNNARVLREWKRTNK